MRAAVVALALLAACKGGRDATRDLCMAQDPAEVKAAAEMLKIGRCTVPVRTWRFARMAIHGARSEAALDALIDRELLAQGALEAGVQPSSKREIEQRIEGGELYALGVELPPDFTRNDDGMFDYQKLKQFVDVFGLPDIDALMAEQGREYLAHAMSERLGDERGAWLGKRCRELRDAGELVLDPELVPGYQPCPP